MGKAKRELTPLGRWLNAGRVRQEDFAEMLAKIRGVAPTQPQISNWSTGKVIPTISTRHLIAKATKGAVPVEAWEPFLEDRNVSSAAVVKAALEVGEVNGRLQAETLIASADGVIDPDEAERLRAIKEEQSEKLEKLDAAAHGTTA